MLKFCFELHADDDKRPKSKPLTHLVCTTQTEVVTLEAAIQPSTNNIWDSQTIYVSFKRNDGGEMREMRMASKRCDRYGTCGTLLNQLIAYL